MWRIAILVCSLITPALAEMPGPWFPSDCIMPEGPIVWRKEIIKRIDDNVVMLSSGECFGLDREDIKTWQPGDEILLPQDRWELINQTRGNQGAEIPKGD